METRQKRINWKCTSDACSQTAEVEIFKNSKISYKLWSTKCNLFHLFHYAWHKAFGRVSTAFYHRLRLYDVLSEVCFRRKSSKKSWILIGFYEMWSWNDITNHLFISLDIILRESIRARGEGDAMNTQITAPLNDLNGINDDVGYWLGYIFCNKTCSIIDQLFKDSIKVLGFHLHAKTGSKDMKLISIICGASEHH